MTTETSSDPLLLYAMNPEQSLAHKNAQLLVQ